MIGVVRSIRRSLLARIARLAITAVVLSPVEAHAVSIVVDYTDGVNEGFNDSVYGASRRTAFEHAAAIWGSLLGGSVTVVVEASMDAMGGGSNSAILGSAGAKGIYRDFSGAPIPDTWYPVALANQLAGYDLRPGVADISARFNGDVDNGTVLGSVDWYYGLDGNPGGDIDFVSVVLHELGHGLGFFDMINEGTGEWLRVSPDDIGYPDVYSLNLRRDGVDDFIDLTNAQRLAALTSNNVVWKGAIAAGEHGGNVPIYSPSPFQAGSSISHWATSLTPNELMEPYYGGPSADPGMTVAAFVDIGWELGDGAPPTTTSTTATPTTTTTTTLPAIDPFLCYKAKTTKGTPAFPPTALSLDDAVGGAEEADLLAPRSLCSPASLDSVPPSDTQTAAVGHGMDPVAPHTPIKGVVVGTTFGTTYIDTVASDRVLVPSAMSVAAPPLPPDPASHGVDNFGCYRVRVPKGAPAPYKGRVVTVGDAFTAARVFIVKKPKLLCMAASLDGGGVEHATGHLLCFKVKAALGEAPFEPHKGVYATHALGTLQLDTKKDDLLCVPAAVTLPN